MSNKNNKKYTPTKTGYKEEEEKLKETVPTKAEQKEIEKLVEKKEEKEEEKKETPLGVKLENAENLDVPYPELGHSVSQLSQFQEHKRKAILGAERDKEFCKKYHI
jgi:hypothetical protein